MSRTLILGLIAALMVPIGALCAAEVSPAEAKLRESLRATALQLRTMQSQRDTLEIAKTEAEQRSEALAAELEALKTQTATERSATERTIADLKAKSAVQAEGIAQLQQAIQEWKTAHKKAADLATSKEVERARLATAGVELKRQVADQRVKNLGMYKVGTEILARYEGFGLGTALTAREPFVGTMRVKLENLVQDYADKLAEQKVKP